MAAVLAAACGPAELPPPDVDAGRTAYLTNGCAACHGDSGRGDGTLGRTLTPQPRDFRDAGAFENGRDVDRIARVIASGIPAFPTPMPAYAHLSEVERRDLAAYVLSLAEDGSP